MTPPNTPTRYRKKPVVIEAMRWDGPRRVLGDRRQARPVTASVREAAAAQRLGVKPDSVKRRLQRRREWELLDRIRTNHQPGREPYRRSAAA